MKHMIRTLAMVVALMTGLTTVSAQTVQVLLVKKVPALPSTITSYMDNPFRYFNIQFLVTGAGSEGIDIFFDMNLTVNTSPLYVRTRPDIIPMQPIHVFNGMNQMSGDVLNTQVLSRTETNFDYSNPVNAQQLPEGTYQLCVDFYLWSDRMNPSRVPITVGPCPTFDICYSGSAPELVSPMAGAKIELNGSMILTPAKKINFFWTPVISNCAGRSDRFRYALKVVKVFDGQNYNDAIRTNPTVLSTEVQNTNHAIFDTLRDVKVLMERGALYVAQVQAEQIPNSRTNESFIIANNGKSQPMPFYWGTKNKPGNPGGPTPPPGFGGWNDEGSLTLGGKGNGNPNNPIDPTNPNNPNDPTNPTNKTKAGYSVSVDQEEGEEDDESEGIEGMTQWEGGLEEESELETIQGQIKRQYLAGFIQDAATIARLTKAYPDERQYVPTPKRQYVESDGYYTVPMTDDLEVSFMPARHKSLKKASYTIELYDYMEGGIDSITSYEPILSEKIDELPESYNKMDSHQLVNRTLAGWGSKLKQGNLYYLQLSRNATVGYWKYSIADTSFYVNEKLAEHIHDTVSRNFVEEEVEYANGVMFQWGDDPKTPSFTTPQWKAPVDRTGDDIYDPKNHKLPASVPEVQKAKSFPVSWAPVKNVAKGDKATYTVNVYELKPDQTLNEAISANTALATRTITDANEISEEDAKFFKVFSPKKTYIITLSTSVDGESDTNYHFENGSSALPVVFKIVK